MSTMLVPAPPATLNKRKDASPACSICVAGRCRNTGKDLAARKENIAMVNNNHNLNMGMFYLRRELKQRLESGVLLPLL